MYCKLYVPVEQSKLCKTFAKLSASHTPSILLAVLIQNHTSMIYIYKAKLQRSPTSVLLHLQTVEMMRCQKDCCCDFLPDGLWYCSNFAGQTLQLAVSRLSRPPRMACMKGPLWQRDQCHIPTHKAMTLEAGMQMLKSMSSKVAHLVTRRQLGVHAVNQCYPSFKVCASS